VVLESPTLCFLQRSPPEMEIVRQINSEFFDPSYSRRWGLARLLRLEQNAAIQREVCAAAWFEGNVTPLLLRDFEIKSRLTGEAATKLRKLEGRAQRAEQAARLTLKEALRKWMRFDPPGMRADTKARIEKAVKLYVTEPDKRSLAKIATEFRVSRKTVSSWFARFTNETDFPVVSHRRHESVNDHLRAEGAEAQAALAGGGGKKTPVRGSKDGDAGRRR